MTSVMDAEGGGKGKKEMVGRMFDDIAPTYDALNHILSLGIDRGWRKKVVNMVATMVVGEAGDSVEARRAGDDSPDVFGLLDVATGTGDLAIALARRISSVKITGVDISEGMLTLGREKVETAELADRVVLQAGDAEALVFEDGAFDCVTVAFGVRNFGDIPAGLRQMQRVVRAGGRCFVLEFSEPRTPIFGWAYRLYFHRVLPFIGRLVSRDRAAYSYLPRSVDAFPAPRRFAEMLRGAGFTQVKIHRLTLGVAYIYEAVK